MQDPLEMARAQVEGLVEAAYEEVTGEHENRDLERALGKLKAELAPVLEALEQRVRLAQPAPGRPPLSVARLELTVDGHRADRPFICLDGNIILRPAPAGLVSAVYVNGVEMAGHGLPVKCTGRADLALRSGFYFRRQTELPDPEGMAEVVITQTPAALTAEQAAPRILMPQVAVERLEVVIDGVRRDVAFTCKGGAILIKPAPVGVVTNIFINGVEHHFPLDLPVDGSKEFPTGNAKISTGCYYVTAAPAVAP